MPLTITSITYQGHQSSHIHCGATSGKGSAMSCACEVSGRLGWRGCGETELTHTAEISFSPRPWEWSMPSTDVCHVSSLWDAAAVLPSKLGTGLPIDIFLIGQIQRSSLVDTSVSLSLSLCVSALHFQLFTAPLSLLFSFFLLLYFSHVISYFVSYPHSAILSLTLSLSLLHTLAATLKTVVAMVTALCCRKRQRAESAQHHFLV